MTRSLPVSSGREHTPDRQTEAIWQRLRSIADVMANAPFINGRLISEEEGASKGSGLAFTAGAQRSIPHGLGRTAIGFVEVQAASQPSPAAVGLFAVAHPSGKTSERFVSVEPTNTGVSYLWVF